MSVYRVWPAVAVLRALLFSATVSSQVFAVVVPMPVHFLVLFLLRNASDTRGLLMAARLQPGLCRPVLCVLQPPSAFVAPAERIQSPVMEIKQKMQYLLLLDHLQSSHLGDRAPLWMTSLPQNISARLSVLVDWLLLSASAWRMCHLALPDIKQHRVSFQKGGILNRS